MYELLNDDEIVILFPFLSEQVSVLKELEVRFLLRISDFDLVYADAATLDHFPCFALRWKDHTARCF